MSEYKLKEKVKQKVKQRLKEARGKKRKETEGRVNIEGVTSPRKHKPKKVKEEKRKKHQSGAVSIGAHGGRYIQEPSGHKRYVSEGKLSGTKRYAKSVKDVLSDVIKKSQVTEFVKNYKRRKDGN